MKIVLNSNLITPDFPHSIRIRLVPLKIFLVAGRNKIFFMGPILFLPYEEKLVSSNLNLKLLRFHSVNPTLYNVYAFLDNYMPNLPFGSFHPMRFFVFIAFILGFFS